MFLELTGRGDTNTKKSSTTMMTSMINFPPGFTATNEYLTNKKALELYFRFVFQNFLSQNAGSRKLLSLNYVTDADIINTAKIMYGRHEWKDA